jgi:Putative phage abortive infection protein
LRDTGDKQLTKLEKERIRNQKNQDDLLDDKEEKKLENKAKKYSKLAWFFSFVTLIIPILGLVMVKVLKVDFEKLGPYGDFVAGSTVPLLTFSSFVLLTATLITQQVQLKVQMKELKLTREEYAKTNKELDEQNKTLLLQRFENTFFNIFSSHNEIMESIRPQFKEIYESFKKKAEVERELKFLNDNISFLHEDHLLEWFKFEPIHFVGVLNGERINENASDSLQYCRKNKEIIHKFFSNVYETREYKYTLINQIYNEIYNEHHHNLGHYFRSLHRLVKYIDNSTIINMEEKKFYLDVVRSQISSFEHIMLFYNCLSPFGNNSFLPLIKKYDLLDEINNELIINKDICNHMELFTEFDELDVDIIYDLNETYQVGFHKKWYDNINNLTKYKSLFEFKIKEIAINYIKKQLIIPRETVKTINNRYLDLKLKEKIIDFNNEMDKYESNKILELKNIKITIDYLTVIKDECKVYKDKGFEIYESVKASSVT